MTEEIERAESVIAKLNDKRKALIERATEPENERQRISFAAHGQGDAKAKQRLGATHFLMKMLPKVASEMALSVLAYNLTRVMNIVGTRGVLAAIRA